MSRHKNNTKIIYRINISDKNHINVSESVGVRYYKDYCFASVNLIRDIV